MKKFILLLTALSMFSANVPAETIDTPDIETDISDVSDLTPRYTAIAGMNNDISISSGKANCYGNTIVSSGYKAKVKVELQQKETSWKTIKTWTVSGNLSATVNEPYTLTKGNSYRLKTTHYALNTDGSVAEYVTQYSKTVTY